MADTRYPFVSFLSPTTIDVSTVTFSVVTGTTVRIAATNAGVQAFPAAGPNAFIAQYDHDPSWGEALILWNSGSHYAQGAEPASDTSSLSGATTLTVTVTTESAVAIPSAVVTIANGTDVRGPLLTNSSGVVVFPVNAGTWTVVASAAGYYQRTTTAVVASSPASKTTQLAAASIPAAAAGTVTGYLTTFDVNNQPADGVAIQFMLEAGDKTPATSYSREVKTVTSAGGGQISIPLLVNSSYKARRKYADKVFGEWVSFTTKTVSPYPIPQILGKNLVGG